MQSFTFIFRGEFREFESHFAQIGTLQTFAPGDIVPTVVGGVPMAYFFKNGGGAHFCTTNEFGKNEMLFVLSDYEIYPWFGLCREFTMNPNAYLVITRGMDAYAFPAHFLQTYFQENLSFARVAVNHIVKISNNLLMRCSLNGYQDAQIKVCIYLYTWITQARAGKHRFIYQSQEEIASWCSISREYLAKILKGLKNEGIIQTSRKCIEITDAEKLVNYCRDLGVIFEP